VGWSVGYVATTPLNRIEFLYLLHGMRSTGFIIIHGLIEHATGMRHAMDQCDARPFGEHLIAHIPIGLQIACKIFQYFNGAFPSASFLVIKKDGFFKAVLIYPVITTVRLSFFLFIQYFDRRFIGVQIITLQHFCF